MRGVADETDMLLAEGRAEDDRRLSVRFTMEPKQNVEKSLAEGRPIYDETEFIRIAVPGDKDTIVHRPVTNIDRRRFAARYEAWKAGRSVDAASGTPLLEWGAISRSRAEELAFFNIRTVEQLAATTDANLQNVGPLIALRQKARDYIEAAKGNAPLEKLRSQLDEANNEREVMRRQIAELAAKVEKQQEKRKGTS